MQAEFTRQKHKSGSGSNSEENPFAPRYQKVNNELIALYFQFLLPRSVNVEIFYAFSYAKDSVLTLKSTCIVLIIKIKNIPESDLKPSSLLRVPRCRPVAADRTVIT